MGAITSGDTRVLRDEAVGSRESPQIAIDAAQRAVLEAWEA
jgi:hypothetical protein